MNAISKYHDWLRGIANGTIAVYDIILLSNKACKIAT